MIRSRRAFLKFLAGSPLFAGLPAFRLQALRDYVISNPAEAIDVFEFEAAARKALPPAHWGYLTTGVDDDATLKANREGFSAIAFPCSLTAGSAAGPMCSRLWRWERERSASAVRICEELPPSAKPASKASSPFSAANSTS